MKWLRFSGFLFFLAFCCFACKEEPVTPTLTVPSEVTLGHSQTEYTLSVQSNSAWEATVTEGGAWLAISPNKGQGNGQLLLSAGVNTGAAREATISVRAGTATATVKVHQGEEAATQMTLAQVRALYKGADVTISEKVVATATVISNYLHAENGGLNNYTSMKAIVVSDGTGGLQLYCAENNTEFLQGDVVELQLRGQTLSVYNNGPLQVNGMPLTHIKKVGTAAVEAKEITVKELLTGAYESMYVAVPNVQIADKDLNKTFVQNTEHTSIEVLAQTKETFDVFSSRYSSFKDSIVPSGCGVLKGIGSVFNGRYQLSFAKLTDWEGLTGERFYTAPTFMLSTTEIECSGEAGSFTVTPGANVDWTVSSSHPDQFALSTTQGSGATPVTVTYKQNPSTNSRRVAVITFTTTHPEVAQKTLELRVVQSPFEALVSDPVSAWMELPYIGDLPQDESFAYISHMTTVQGQRTRNYSFWYDTQNKVSLWVAYPLYTTIMSSGSRSDAWEYNPKVPKRYQPELYVSYNGPYDRGHQLPSADRLYTQDLNKSTFYFTNIAPQDREFNSGLWGRLEGMVRSWAIACDTLYVVTGVCLTTAEDTEVTYVSDHRGTQVGVPKVFYKALLRYKKSQTENGGYSAIGFVYENQAHSNKEPKASHARTIKEMEALTGVDFFHNLPAQWQEAVEDTCDPADWGLN